MSTAYQEFIARKAVHAPMRGLPDVPPLAGHLFEFQRQSVAFGLRAGSWGCFLDTGLGKTACELEWSTHAAAASNGKALILTPLAVARQIETEGKRWGYPVRVVRDMGDVAEGVNVCNYDRLHLLEAEGARHPDDEKHICPMPLDLITRAVVLWSNPGDTVADPFMGIGSTGVVALRQGRRFIGSELKASYFKQAVDYLDAEDRQLGLLEQGA